MLEKVNYVVIEYGDDENEITAYLQARGFSIVQRTQHNLIAAKGIPQPLKDAPHQA